MTVRRAGAERNIISAALTGETQPATMLIVSMVASDTRVVRSLIDTASSKLRPNVNSHEPIPIGRMGGRVGRRSIEPIPARRTNGAVATVGLVLSFERLGSIRGREVMIRTSSAAIAATISSLLLIANTDVATAAQIKILSGSA